MCFKIIANAARISTPLTMGFRLSQQILIRQYCLRGQASLRRAWAGYISFSNGPAKLRDVLWVILRFCSRRRFTSTECLFWSVVPGRIFLRFGSNSIPEASSLLFNLVCHDRGPTHTWRGGLCKTTLARGCNAESGLLNVTLHCLRLLGHAKFGLGSFSARSKTSVPLLSRSLTSTDAGCELNWRLY